MGTRGGLISFCCVILAVALVTHWVLPSRTNTVFVVEPIDPSVLDRIVIKGFTPLEGAMIRRALLPKFTGRCEEAFNRAGLRSPWRGAWGSGIVVQDYGGLYVKE